MIQSLLRINQKQIIAAEYITVLAGFLFYTGALPTILTDTFGVPSQLFTLMRYGITLPGLLLILLQPKHILQQIIHGKYAWFIMLLGMLCFLWSSNPPIPLGTIRSELLPMALFSLYVAARIPLKMQFNLIGLTMKFVSLTSVFYALFLPHIGVHHEKWPGAWKGLFEHKNQFGGAMTLTTGIFFIEFLKSKEKGPAQILPMLITLSAAVVSGSMGALILSQVFCILIFAITLIRWRGKQSVFWTYLIVVSAVVGLGVLLAIWSPLLTGIGKDPTISARTEIWEAARMEVARSPISLVLGFGRGVKWKDPNFMLRVWLHTGDAPANAHNGFFDLMLDLGYFGLFIFFVGYVIVLAKALRLAYQAPRPEYMWPVAFLIVLIMQNYLESYLFRQEQLNWVLFLIISSNIDKWNGEREWLERKKKRQSQYSDAALGQTPGVKALPAESAGSMADMGHSPIDSAALLPPEALRPWDRVTRPRFKPRRDRSSP